MWWHDGQEHCKKFMLFKFGWTKIIRELSWMSHVVMCNAEMDALFWIHLIETWLNIFMLLLVALNFLTFLFSTGIKLFIQHPVVLFDILILSEQFDDFVQLPLWCILKDRQLCLHRYLKCWVLYAIIALAKQFKIQHMALIRIRLLL